MNSEFGENVLGMVPSSMGTDAQCRRDFLVGSPFGQKHRHLHFAGRETVLQLEVNRARQLGIWSTVPGRPTRPLAESAAKGSHFGHRAPDLLE
jgi:hypothetical protein